MHMTDLAPVLSATSSRDCIWIMSFPNLPGHPDLAGLPNSLGPVEPAEREVRPTGGLGGAGIPKVHRAVQTKIPAKPSIMPEPCRSRQRADGFRPRVLSKPKSPASASC